ncbi:MAG: TonB-dependent receptor [Burkholderiaceae bacterium]|nr:TonB-dependent receptor [Burkholderiaceae bacterium]
MPTRIACALQAAVGLTLLVAGAVQAQQPPAEASAQLERVTVTGSNIRRVDAETASPVQVITREDIERSGRQTVADVVRLLPADNNGSISTAFGAGFAAGASGVALRGLTVNGTLVLLNGRRLAPYGLADDGQRTFVDLNSIPLEAVQRIEVLKDGASAIYGSDAIAGVVNVILRRDFRGAAAAASYGLSGDGDGDALRASVGVGHGDLAADRFNVFVNLEAASESRIRQSDRGGFLATSDLRGFGYNDNRPGFVVPGVAVSSSPVGNVQPRNPDGSAIPGQNFRSLAGCAPDNADPGGGCLWEPIDYADIQPRTRRVNLFGRASFALAPDVLAFAEAGVFHSQVATRSTPSPITGVWPDALANRTVDNRALLVPVGHPDNPFPTNPMRARFVAADKPRTGEYQTTVSRLLAGLEGEFAQWNYETAIGYVRSDTDIERRGYVRASALATAIANGTYRLGVNHGLTASSVIEAVYPTLNYGAQADVSFIDGRATRTLGTLAGRPIGLALGAEFRRETNDTEPTPFTAQADIVGLGYSSFQASRNVAALYGEVALPVLSTLELQLAARADRYSDAGTSMTPKAGLKYTPLAGLALRGTYAEGFRAPGPAENGTSSSAGFVPYVDPVRCPVTDLPSDCGGGGLVLITRGNPAVEPEKSRSYTLGVVLEPAPGLSTSIDWWRIERRNEIVAADQAIILANPGAIPAASVVRDEPSPAFPALAGPVLAVSAPYINASRTQTDGIDFDVRYRFAAGAFGRISSGLQATRLRKFTRILPDGTRIDYAGTHGPTALSGNAGMPKTRAALDFTLERGPLASTLRMNHVSGMRNVEQQGGDCLNHVDETGADAPANCRIGSFTTTDLHVRWTVQTGWDISASVRNLLDRAPPFDPQTYGGINYNPTYHQDGAIGRFFTVGTRFRW